MPRLARPLPVEYLLIDVPASMPLTPQFTFYISDNVTPFPIENRYANDIRGTVSHYTTTNDITKFIYRPVDGHLQEFSSLCSYMQQFNKEQFLKAVSDFHLLIYIATMDMFPMKVRCVQF